MKLFILETYSGDRWIQLGFFPGDYRSIINELGDNYTRASRVRRVRSLEECLELEGCMARELVPVDTALSNIRMVSLSVTVRRAIEWLE